MAAGAGSWHWRIHGEGMRPWLVVAVRALHHAGNGTLENQPNVAAPPAMLQAA